MLNGKALKRNKKVITREFRIFIIRMTKHIEISSVWNSCVTGYIVRELCNEFQ